MDKETIMLLLKELATQSGQIDTYIKNRGFDKTFYKKLVMDYISISKTGVSKSEVKKLLWEKLPDIMKDDQKVNKVTNILQELKREKKIINTGTDAKPFWKLTH